MDEKNSKFVPKSKINVKILTENSHSQVVSDYAIFLKLKEGAKTESLKEFLQCENRLFLPLIRNNNTFELMNIHNIVYIKETEKSSIKAGKTVTLTLINGAKLKLKLFSNFTEDRISDFVNSKDNFLEFLTEDDFLIYVNKDKVFLVKEKSIY